LVFGKDVRRQYYSDGEVGATFGTSYSQSFVYHIENGYDVQVGLDAESERTSGLTHCLLLLMCRVV